MKTLFANGKIIINDNYIYKDILVEDGKIVEIGSNVRDFNKKIDLENKILSPGFIEIHSHGGRGVDVNNAEFEDYKVLSKHFAQNGVTSFFVSILTDSQEKTKWCISQAVKAIDTDLPGGKVAGIHLEGPFLNPLFKGAMPEKFLSPFDLKLLEKYQEVAKGNIKYITLAPEICGDISVIKKIKDLGITVGIGHSNADYKEAMEAEKHGASLATHLFNAMRGIDHHEMGIVGACLSNDMYVETILDGLHLAKETVKFISKIKGLDKIIGITDSIMAAGLGDGNYKLGVNDVIVKNKDARLKTEDTRAGSILTTQEAIKNAVKFFEEDFCKVNKIFTKNPAQALKLEGLGELKVGNFADLVIIDEELNILETIVNGKTVYSK